MTSVDVERRAYHRSAPRRTAIVVLLVAVVAVVGAVALLVARRESAPTVRAEQRATQTLSDLGAPVSAAKAQPVVTYHWPSCEQGDCYNKSRTFRLSAPRSLADVGVALAAWAAAHGLANTVVSDCVSSKQQTLLPEEHGCYRSWYAGDRSDPLVTVWVHFSSPATVVGSAQDVGAPSWQHYAHELVAEVVVDAVAADPLPQ